MPQNHLSRRVFTLGMAALPIGVGVPTAPSAAAVENTATGASDGLLHTAAAIHQEVTFMGSCVQIYEALTTATRFDALTRLSDAATLLTAPHAQETAISGSVGGPFTLFGGYITGRNLEMVPSVRLVQAWRAGGWDLGEFSIVRFVLRPDGSACRLTFDHRGFPDAQGPSLAYGWRVHYWEPLAKLLQRS
jgi:activator of HSP90 ATPase